jgi:N-acyl-D-aspartate/D-glutamate deacylase
LLCDIVIDDNLNTVIANQDKGQDRETWEKRVQVWRDHRAVVGASDAGAHLDMIDSYAFSTTMLARAVREHDLMPLEEAVYHLTDRPARLYGLKNRGRIAEGWAADITVFNADTVGPGPAEMRFDLPGGAGRVYGESIGVEHVIVNGVPAVRNNVALDARPGTLLRSGRDTETVTAQ